MMKIAVIGTGYVGLITGVCFAEKGFRVFLVDIDKKKMDKIRNGLLPIHEPRLDELLRRNLKKKRIFPTTDLARAICESNISIVAVGTPYRKNGLDISAVGKAALGIGKALRNKKEYHVVVIKSTVPPGTTDNLVLPMLEKYSHKQAGVHFGVGANPEFLREGKAIHDFIDADRIVVGGIDKKTTDAISGIYRFLKKADVIITNNSTAEMIKYASNSLLAALISFSNEIANICSLSKNVDVEDVMAGVHLDKRLNPMRLDGKRARPEILHYLRAGCGFGGSCFPKDVKALISYAESRGMDPKLLRAVIEINESQPYKLIGLLEKHYPSLARLKIAVLGLAFKPDTDDVRESPAIPIIKMLRRKGAYIKAYDPVAAKNARRALGTRNITYCKSLAEALSDVSAAILVTSWAEFKNLHVLVNRLSTPPLIIDGRRVLDKRNYEKYSGIGV